jgi:TonB family protein
MPTLRPASLDPSRRRSPLVPRRRVELARNSLAWAAAISAALHIAAIVALIITFPNKPPPEAAPPTGIQMVFESGAKTAAAPAAKQGPNQKARQAAPRGPKAPRPARVAQAAPPLPPPPPAPPPTPVAPPPPKPVTPPPPEPPAPKPVTAPPAAPPVPPHEVAPPPVAHPAPPLAKPVAPKPPTPPLPKINLPPPPPPAPPVPTPPIPVPAPPTPAPPAPAPPTPPPPSADDSQAEMNLELPPLPEFAPIPLPLPPPPLPPAPPRPPQRIAGNRSRTRSSSLGGMVMNGLSFNGGGSPSGGRTTGLNLDLPETAQPGSESDLTVRGDVGANWIAELEQWVDAHKYYPEMAGELNQQGTVIIRFTVDRAGHVSHLAMVTPTGYALLNEAWLGLFRNADLPPFPPDAKSDTATITASMRFEIIH